MERIDGRGGDRAFDLVRKLREVTERQRRLRDVHGQHVANGLAHRERVEQHEAIGVRLDERREPCQHLETITWRHASPAPVSKRAAARRDGRVDIGRGASRNLAQRFGACGVHHSQASAPPVDVLAVDEMPGCKRQARGQAVPVCARVRMAHSSPRPSECPAAASRQCGDGSLLGRRRFTPAVRAQSRRAWPPRSGQKSARPRA